MLKKKIGVILLLSSHCLLGQQSFFMGARSSSLAEASVALIDSWSYYNNPAATAFLVNRQIGICCQNRFFVNELLEESLVGIVPVNKGAFSTGIYYSGWEAYKKVRGGLGYALKMNEKLSAGVQLNYQHLAFAHNYGNINALTVEAGILIKLSNEFTLACSVFNLNRTKIAKDNTESLPLILRIGGAHRFSTASSFLVEVLATEGFMIRWKTGMEFLTSSKLALRMGLALNPIELSGGLGYRFRDLQLDFGSSFQQRLGWSPHFSFVFLLEKNG